MAPRGSANGEALLLSVQKGVPVSSITVNYGCKSLDGVPILITICKYDSYQCPTVNWNGQLEHYRFAVMLLSNFCHYGFDDDLLSRKTTQQERVLLQNLLVK